MSILISGVESTIVEIGNNDDVILDINDNEKTLLSTSDDETLLTNVDTSLLIVGDDEPEIRIVEVIKNVLLETGSSITGAQGAAGAGFETFNMIVPAFTAVDVFVSVAVGRSIKAQISIYDAIQNLHRAYTFNGGVTNLGPVDSNVTDIVGDPALIDILPFAINTGGVFTLTITNNTVNNIESSGLVSII